MNEFVVVDLYSQRREVENHVRGWPEEQVLNWLSGFGEVDELKLPMLAGLYRFRSVVGSVTLFSFDAEKGFSVQTSGWYYQ
jgi:hypothetical protein